MRGVEGCVVSLSVFVQEQQYILARGLSDALMAGQAEAAISYHSMQQYQYP